MELSPVELLFSLGQKDSVGEIGQVGLRNLSLGSATSGVCQGFYLDVGRVIFIALAVSSIRLR